MEGSTPCWFKENGKGEDPSQLIGKPDVCLCSENGNTVVLLELKINAKKTNVKYSLQQHIKYGNFKKALEAEGKQVIVGLLVPDKHHKASFLTTTELEWFDYEDWRLSSCLDRVHCKPANVHWKNIKTWDDYRTELKIRARSFNVIWDPLEVDAVPVISFDDLEDAFEEQGLKHLKEVTAQIREYAQGG